MATFTYSARTLGGDLQSGQADFKSRDAGVGTVAVKRVKPGRYDVRVSATDAAGLVSAAKRKVVVRG